MEHYLEKYLVPIKNFINKTFNSSLGRSVQDRVNRIGRLDRAAAGHCFNMTDCRPCHNNYIFCSNTKQSSITEVLDLFTLYIGTLLSYLCDIFILKNGY